MRSDDPSRHSLLLVLGAALSVLDLLCTGAGLALLILPKLLDPGL
jgi:hypothetical protein